MAKVHHREFTELPVTVDRSSDIPLPEQIVASLREAIDHGTLRPGEPVPATRELAARLRVARGVVVAAYQQLIAEGYLSAGHGRGTRVHPDLRELRSSTLDGALGPDARGIDSTQQPGPDGDSNSHATLDPRTPGPLAPGLPDTSAVATAAWKAAWRQAVALDGVEAPDLGDPRLRGQLTEHLRRMRGTTRPVDDVLVTAGAREGLALLLSALGSFRGGTLTVGVEDPGYPSLRRVASRQGAQILALPVDAEGLMTHVLPETGLDAVIVTPSHQYPLGGSLPLSRRRELLEWAHRTGAVIIEDDYDSELRHTGSPLPTLAALDDRIDGAVSLLGTFSKTVSPALSAGFLLLPENLRRIVEPARHDLGGPVSAVVQAALANYLESGELRRHTARMRRRYASRRELVVERLLGVRGARVRPMSGGLHAVIEFRPGSAEAERRVFDACAGLGVVPLSAYWHGETGGGDRFGLVIGTGGSLGDDQFDAALHALRRVLTDQLGPERSSARSINASRSTTA